MDKQRLQKICVIIALISLPVFLLTTVFVSIVDASIENMVHDQIGDIAVFTGVSITTLKNNMRSMIVNGELPILNTLFSNDQSLTSFSNAFLKQAVSEVLAQTDFFSRLCILLWAYGENVKQISLVCFIVSVVVWYLTGGRPSDIRNLFASLGGGIKQFNKHFATRKEKQSSYNEAISISKSPLSQNGDSDSFFKKMCICAIVATIILVGVYFFNHSLPQGNKGDTVNYYHPSYNTSYIYWEPTATPSPTPKRTPSPTPTRTPTNKSTLVVGQYCRINDPGANVRSGPSTNYNKIGLAPENNWYLIVDYDRENTSKDWYKINMDGTYCWIYSELVELDGNTNGTTNGKPVSNPNSNSSSNTVSIIGETCYIFDDGNNVRSGPGTNYSIIGQVNSGASFKIYDYEICTTGKKPRDWYKIYFNGQYGWISSGIVELHGHRDGTAYGVRVYD